MRSRGPALSRSCGPALSRGKVDDIKVAPGLLSLEQRSCAASCSGHLPHVPVCFPLPPELPLSLILPVGETSQEVCAQAWPRMGSGAACPSELPAGGSRWGKSAHPWVKSTRISRASLLLLRERGTGSETNTHAGAARAVLVPVTEESQGGSAPARPLENVGALHGFHLSLGGRREDPRPCC